MTRTALSTTRREPIALHRGASLLLVVWALSGVWSIAHAIDHDAGHDSTGHVSAEHAHQHVSVAASHDDGHSHPERLPFVSSAKAPDLKTVALLASLPAFEATAAPLRWIRPDAEARASSRVGSVSEPRAPPLS